MEQDLRHARDEAAAALLERDGAKGRAAELEAEALRLKQDVQSSHVQRAASDATATSLKSQLDVAASGIFVEMIKILISPIRLLLTNPNDF